MIGYSIGLSYTDDLPETYFSDFVTDVEAAGTAIRIESRENTPYAALEWILPGAIALYLGKPFIDVLLKRAADDFGDAVYPRLKGAITALAQKVFVRSPLRVCVISSSEHKAASSNCLLFSIHAPGLDDKRLKFVFDTTVNETQFIHCIESLLGQLADYHRPDLSDQWSAQIANLANPQAREIFLIYDVDSRVWNVMDPTKKIAELAERQ